jgi:branched-subunit amino acid transport protein AzlD
VHLWRGNLFLSLFVGTGVCVVLANGWLAHFL